MSEHLRLRGQPTDSDEQEPALDGFNRGMHRVKLYKLNSEGCWDDKGTGHVGVEFLPVRCLLHAL